MSPATGTVHSPRSRYRCVCFSIFLHAICVFQPSSTMLLLLLILSKLSRYYAETIPKFSHDS